jgi:hypothetical protein
LNKTMVSLLLKLKEFGVPYIQYYLPVIQNVLKSLLDQLKTTKKSLGKRDKFDQEFGQFITQARSKN